MHLILFLNFIDPQNLDEKANILSKKRWLNLDEQNVDKYCSKYLFILGI